MKPAFLKGLSRLETLYLTTYLRSGSKYVGTITTYVPVLDIENCLFFGLTYISKPNEPYVSAEIL